MRCTGVHAAEVEATGYVRTVPDVGGEVIAGPYCDACQVGMCKGIRILGGIQDVGAVPLDYRERMTEARRTGIVRRFREGIERHPGGPGEVADDIVAAILQTSGTVLPSLVLARLERWRELAG